MPCLIMHQQRGQRHDLDVRLTVVLDPQDQMAVLDLGHLQSVMVAAYGVHPVASLRLLVARHMHMSAWVAPRSSEHHALNPVCIGRRPISPFHRREIHLLPHLIDSQDTCVHIHLTPLGLVVLILSQGLYDGQVELDG